MSNNLIKLDDEFHPAPPRDDQRLALHRMTITCRVISADENDPFRHAFSMIARAALPFMSSDCPYYSDLLYDAALATQMRVGEHMYFLVREYGTNHFKDPVDAMRHCTDRSDGMAVLRVDRMPYDRFKAEIIYTRDSGYILTV
jgi:hypothetical protein